MNCQNKTLSYDTRQVGNYPKLVSQKTAYHILLPAGNSNFKQQMAQAAHNLYNIANSGSRAFDTSNRPIIQSLTAVFQSKSPSPYQILFPLSAE